MKCIKTVNTSLFISVCVLFIFSACGKNAENTSSPIEEPDPVSLKEDYVLKIPSAVFSDPVKIKNKKSSTEILDALVQCINAAPANSSIHASVYLFDYPSIYMAFAKAHNRGVYVNVMIDSSKESSISANSVSIAYLQSILQGDSKLVAINSDVSSTSINHHKHVLFSELKLDGKIYKSVVFSTSENFTNHETTVLQDAVILDDDDLYNAFLFNWNAMLQKADSGMKYFEYQEFVSKDGGFEAYFLPRRKNGAWDGNFTMMEILNRAMELEDITIKVGMSQWSDARIDIVRKLIEMREKGATVEVITRSTNVVGDEVKSELAKLKAMGGYVNLLKSPTIIHSKLVLIEGIRNGKKETFLINGTFNFINPELKNNNNLILLLRNSVLFEDYIKNFDEIKMIFD